MNSDLIRLAHTGANPEMLRRLVRESGASGAVRRLRSGARTHPTTRAALDIDPRTRMARLSSSGVDLIATDDERFPVHLRELPDHPLWLFTRGALPAAPGVAVVGSRRATRYGLELAEAISARIAEAGWPVISGLAAGIDAAAHKGAVEVTGMTVAVLGSGVDVWYPRRNRTLGERILANGGSVISEFPPGTTPEPWRFPARNRIISGLAGAVIVVEAAARSGALITARLALEHDRLVMAVPGDLSRETSLGANLLIRDGAHPVTDLESLVEEIEFVMGAAPRPSMRDAATSVDPILELVGTSSTPVDELAERAGLPIAELLVRLTDLELAGLVTLNEGFVRTA